jgi:hypothetical protein
MRHFFSGCVLVAVGWFCFGGHLDAQTNRPPVLPVPSDSERFFDAYTKAIGFLREKKPQEAVIAMDQICKQVTTSPWMEIALLKYSELVEGKSSKSALENYALLRNRVQNAPYFQGTAPYARLFRAALEGATGNGINRIRINRIRESLSSYFAKYSEYPESLAKLSILGYIEMADIQNVDGRTFRYIPTGIQLTPFISYKRYEPFESPPLEPFYVTMPVLEGTSQVSNPPLKYAALIKMSPNSGSLRIVENQTLHGFLVCAIASDGAILCSTDRILILPVNTSRPAPQ